MRSNLLNAKIYEIFGITDYWQKDFDKPIKMHHFKADNRGLFATFSLGVNATSSTVKIGNKCFLEQSGVTLKSIDDVIQNSKKTGDNPQQNIITKLYIAVNNQCIGLITLTSKIRPEAQYVINSIRHGAFGKNTRIYMLTGDNERAAFSVASILGIKPNNVFSNQTPNDKNNTISQLKKTCRVSVVGDGENDIPAMCESDIAFAPRQSDYSAAVADILLTRIFYKF